MLAHLGGSIPVDICNDQLSISVLLDFAPAVTLEREEGGPVSAGLMALRLALRRDKYLRSRFRRRCTCLARVDSLVLVGRKFSVSNCGWKRECGVWMAVLCSGLGGLVGVRHGGCWNPRQPGGVVTRFWERMVESDLILACVVDRMV